MVPIQRALVTGGAGFIGSHVVDHLLNERGAEVIVYDDFRSGQEIFLEEARKNDRFSLVEADVLDLERLESSMRGCDFVFHLQANADVRGGLENRRVDLEQNTIATWNVLEAMSRQKVGNMAFASSATIYGEPETYPTPEGTAPLQTSLYGASKYACEAMIQAYSEYFQMRSWIYRFVSWTGPRYTHGVVYDFVRKLESDPEKLFILGNGKAQKSYLDVEDGVSGIFTAIDKARDLKNVINLGHDDFISVLEVADVICEELGLDGVEYEIEDPDKDRGWVGDSPLVHLDTSRLRSLGWSSTISIPESLRRTVRYLKEHEVNRELGG